MQLKGIQNVISTDPAVTRTLALFLPGWPCTGQGHRQSKRSWIGSSHLNTLRSCPRLCNQASGRTLFRHSDTAYTPFCSYSGTFGINTQFLCTPTFKMARIPKGLGCSTCLYLNRNKFFLVHCSFYLTEQIGFLTFYFLLFNDFYSLG